MTDPRFDLGLIYGLRLVLWLVWTALRLHLKLALTDLGQAYVKYFRLKLRNLWSATWNAVYDASLSLMNVMFVCVVAWSVCDQQRSSHVWPWRRQGRPRPWLTCCRRVGIKSPSVLMEINVMYVSHSVQWRSVALVINTTVLKGYEARSTVSTARFCDIFGLLPLMKGLMETRSELIVALHKWFKLETSEPHDYWCWKISRAAVDCHLGLVLTWCTNTSLFLFIFWI